MEYQTIQQFIRILIFAAGSYFLGDGVANGEMFQSFVAGIVNVVNFVWWAIWNSKTTMRTSK